MELESLKYIWHSLQAPPVREQDRRALLALVTKRSQASVARMRRNLIGEGILLLVTYTPAILCFLLGFNGRLTVLAWLFAGMAVLFLAYYFQKYRLLKAMQCPTCRLRSNLALQVDTLKKYTRLYLLAGTGLVPLMYLLCWLIIGWKLSVFWLALLIPVTVGIYYLNSRYINRLYGRHIKKLQELLHELDSD